MQVRRREPDDLAACVAVLDEVHRVDGYPSVWPDDPVAWLSLPRTYAAWVAVDGAAVRGHVLLAPTSRPESVEVARLFTAPAARGNGAARALLATAVGYATRHGAQAVLGVVDHAAAAGFYDRLGWRRTGRSRANWRDATGAQPWLVHFAHDDG